MTVRSVKKITRSSHRKTRSPSSCRVCRMGAEVSYKNVLLLKKLISDRGKIMPKSKTGICSKHQRQVTREIKKARFLALLPYTDRHAL